MGFMKRHWEEQEEVDKVWLALQNLARARDKIKKKLVPVKKGKKRK